MAFRFRIWMPIAVILTVLLTVALMFAYGIPAVQTRLRNYAQDRTLARAAATADALSGERRSDWRQTLRASVGEGRTSILVVDQEGEVVLRAGSPLPGGLPEEVRRNAASGKRMRLKLGGRWLAVVPINRGGELFGGLVLVSGEPGGAVYRIFLRAGVEAAAIASVFGGGLALLISTLLTRRVERLAHGARTIESGDLSYRIKPGYRDEFGELAEAFNAMAGRLEKSFSRIEEERETLRAVLDNLTEGVLATDLKGRVIFANPAAREMLGLDDRDGPQQLPDPWPEFSLPEAVARCARRERCGEARVRGQDTFLRVRLEHLPHFDDHRGGVLVVVQDLSEGLRLEARQQRFLANAAHELKTPLTAILGAAELLLTEEEDDPEVRRRFLEHIHSEARRMQRLSETLLRLARTGWDHREPELRPLDPKEAARRAAESMRPLADRDGVSIQVEGEGSRAYADPEWLEQALLVLLGNALRHSERGGEIRLRVSGPSITVEDEGEGIREEDLPHVFERFYRGRGSTGGFGLGLSICKELVEGMGGEISIASERGIGTAVTVELREEEDG
ncbi:sensor histidine kinase [Rubrobacter xylanophilus]|uniref:sensor histidine kinase n=1 Tax=Rubrobacter xylanophilus TaxID=49319 RepID=UPI001C644886|nr:ATP-binding protein [Rubrobacter xylanophilus]